MNFKYDKKNDWLDITAFESVDLDKFLYEIPLERIISIFGEDIVLDTIGKDECKKHFDLVEIK